VRLSNGQNLPIMEIFSSSPVAKLAIFVDDPRLLLITLFFGKKAVKLVAGFTSVLGVKGNSWVEVIGLLRREVDQLDEVG